VLISTYNELANFKKEKKMEKENENASEVSEKEDMETEENDEHPLDSFYGAIEDLQSQIKRLKSGVQLHNLTYELSANIYPILEKAFVSIFDFCCYVDDILSQNEETKEVIEKINNAKEQIEKFKEKLPDNLKKEYDEMLSSISKNFQ